MDNRKLELVTDFYEFTMSNAYFVKNMSNSISYFDIFFRSNPFNGGYAVMGGLDNIVDYINNFKIIELMYRIFISHSFTMQVMY